MVSKSFLYEKLTGSEISPKGHTEISLNISCAFSRGFRRRRRESQRYSRNYLKKKAAEFFLLF